MANLYDDDVVGWAEQQNRLRVLIAHLLKWAHQPARRGRNWRRTIREQRAAIAHHLMLQPSLKPLMDDPHWLESAFVDARTDAFVETGIPNLPLNLPWSLTQLMAQDFLPE